MICCSTWCCTKKKLLWLSLSDSFSPVPLSLSSVVFVWIHYPPSMLLSWLFISCRLFMILLIEMLVLCISLFDCVLEKKKRKSNKKDANWFYDCSFAQPNTHCTINCFSLLPSTPKKKEASLPVHGGRERIEVHQVTWTQLQLYFTTLLAVSKKEKKKTPDHEKTRNSYLNPFSSLCSLIHRIQ